MSISLTTSKKSSVSYYAYVMPETTRKGEIISVFQRLSKTPPYFYLIASRLL